MALGRLCGRKRPVANMLTWGPSGVRPSSSLASFSSTGAGDAFYEPQPQDDDAASLSAASWLSYLAPQGRVHARVIRWCCRLGPAPEHPRLPWPTKGRMRQRQTKQSVLLSWHILPTSGTKDAKLQRLGRASVPLLWQFDRDRPCLRVNNVSGLALFRGC
jgi:hypothetical protein